MLKTCSRCGGLHPIGYRCNKGRIYKKSDADKLRNTSKWQKKRKQIVEDSFGLCEVCKAQGVYTYEGLEVHHITKLNEDADGLLDDDNLVTLCTFHHKEADAGKIDAEYLRELARERGRQ